LSLLEIKSQGLTPKWIARRLGINELHAKLCFERLRKLGLIEKSRAGWRQTKKPLKIENQVSTDATRRFHRQLLEKAIGSLEADPIEVRDFSSMTMALNPEVIPYARQRIRQFRRELTAELEAHGKPSEVYNLTVQIYPVSKKENGK